MEKKAAHIGLAPTDHNTGGVLGVVEGRYEIYVVEPGTNPLPVINPEPGLLSWPVDPANQRPVTVTTVPIEGAYPFGLANVEVFYTMRMPGFVLSTGTINPTNGQFSLDFDPLALHEDFPNLDLTAQDQDQVGLADPILISLFLTGETGGVPVYHSAMVFMDGDEVFLIAGSPWVGRYLPIIPKN
jgi:hypothetical protein